MLAEHGFRKSSDSFAERFADRGLAGFRRLPKGERGYDPSQPRDDAGRWTGGGDSMAPDRGDGSGGQGTSPTSRDVPAIEQDMDAWADKNNLSVDWEEDDVSEYEQQANTLWDTLDDDTKAAFKNYVTSKGSRDINRYMRGQSTARGVAGKRIAKQAAAMQQAMEESDLKDGTVLFRAMSVSDSEFSDLEPKLTAGGEIRDDGFMSTTPSFGIAKEYAIGNIDPGTHADGERSRTVLFKLTTREAKGTFLTREAAGTGWHEHVLQSGGRIAISKLEKLDSGIIVVEGEVSHAR